MQLTPFLTALLTLSSAALALPTADTTEALSTADASIFNNTTPLEPRANYGWLSSYAPDDTNCAGGWGGDRPKVEGGGCIDFKPITNNVGIYHGSWPINFGSLHVYLDKGCKQYMKTIAPPADGDRQCIHRNEYTFFNWGSVKPA